MGWVGAQLLRYRHSSSFFSRLISNQLQVYKKTLKYIYFQKGSLSTEGFVAEIL